MGTRKKNLAYACVRGEKGVCPGLWGSDIVSIYVARSLVTYLPDVALNMQK